VIATTLNRIRAHHPCEDGWKKLLAGLNKTEPDDEPLAFARILEINGLSDAVWCCRAEPRYAREWLLYAVWCARRLRYLMVDPRSIAALDVAERYAVGAATREELLQAVEADRAGTLTVSGRPPVVIAWEWAAWWAAEATASAWAGTACTWAEAKEKQAAQFLKVVTETEARS
jgi:hypothetical protein